MQELRYTKCSRKLTETELTTVEVQLGIKLPEILKKHYLKYNGGNIENSFLTNKRGDFEVSNIRFIPMLYSNHFINDPDFCIPVRTIEEWNSEKGNIPRNLLPFAFASPTSRTGYLCFNSEDGSIHFYERWKKTEQLMANSFQELIDLIVIKEPEPPIIIMNHPYWGGITESWNELVTINKFSIPYFDQDIKIHLGREDNEEEEINIPITDQLDDFKETFKNFLHDIEKIVPDIKQQTFDRYNKLYAHYYEDESKSGQEPLNIDTPEKHFEALKDINYIRIQEKGVIHIPIFYGLDREHGIEIKIKDNKVECIGGIGEVY